MRYRRLLIALAGLAASACAGFGSAAPASASTTQLAMFEVPMITDLNTSPAATLQVLRSLGVDILRLPVVWNTVAPDAGSRARPAGFDAANPADYPAQNWVPYDTVIRDAAADGIAVDLMPTGGAPLWATRPGAPPCSTVGGKAPVCFTSDFFPSASEYGQFVRALGIRYSGRYVPSGSSSRLPRASFWEIWNEANWGPALTPQYYHSTVPVSAAVYRGLLDTGWSALQATGHGRDTVILSGLSQDGSAHPGESGTSAPLTFIRTLYCVNSAFRQLRGALARQAGCPASSSAYRRFRAQHPALFKLAGVGIHPYPYGKPPTKLDFPNPNGVEFAEIPHLVTTMNLLQRVYRSHRRIDVYNTEYGYQTGFAGARNAAKYINWAEYLSWKNPRIASYDQFELIDASWFPSGLITLQGTFKPSFAAYRLPVWLPVTSTRRGRALEVWGDARPAHFAIADGHRPQYLYIQFSRGGRGSYLTVRRVRITNPRGYFEVRVKFPSSGAVRLAWEYPPGDPRLTDPIDPSRWVYSRVTDISLR